MTVKTYFGNFTGDKATLNLISLMASHSADLQELRGNDALVKRYSYISDSIYDALDAVGYYDNCKC